MSWKDKFKIKENAQKAFDKTVDKKLADPNNMSIAARLYRKKLALEKAQKQ
tara:strand:+ start:882 stop:1034 length:153 start_codon:yes stop_codon:yes gene_type:complete